MAIHDCKADLAVAVQLAQDLVLGGKELVANGGEVQLTFMAVWVLWGAVSGAFEATLVEPSGGFGNCF